MSAAPIVAEGPVPRRWLVLGIVALSFLPVTVDSTVLYLAVPALSQALGASRTQVLWIMDVYPLTMAGLVLLAGPAGDRFGQRNLLLLGLGLFGLASAAAAFAPSAPLLIAARVALAGGGCMIIPSTLAIVRRGFTDPHERGLAIGLWGAVASAGSAAGPVIGGLLLDHFWWGSVFLVNIPLVLVTGALIAGLVGNEAQATAAPLRPLTALAGILGVVAVVYGIKAAAHGEGLSALPAAAAGTAALGFFTWRQLRLADPMLDLRLFAIRRFSVGVLIAVGPIMVLVGFVLALLQQLQLVAGLSPLDAGLTVVPLDVAAALTGPLAGRLLARVGLRPLAVAGLILAASAYFLLLGGGPILVAVIAAGAGHGALMALATNTVMTAAPPEKAGAAAAIESVAYELGTGLGVALFGSLLGAAFAARFADPAAGDSIAAALAEAARLGGAEGAALAEAARTAFDGAFGLALAVAAGTCLLLALAIWHLGRPAKALHKAAG